jgi:tryptophan synthase beta chain
MLPKLQFQKGENVVVTVSGRGDKDMNTYVNYFKLEE